MSYIGKHWRGELSLAKSFWINVLLINIGIRLFEVWLTAASPIENPVVASQVTIAYTFIAFAIVYPWQIIGLWRSANRHVEETKKGFWAGAVKFFVVLGLLGTLGNLKIAWPIYKDLYQIGFEKDKYGDYRVELADDGSLIHLQGGLGFGVSKEVKHLIDKNPNIKGIILDSYGGRLYEGRELSKIILINGLDTYSLKGCYSACGTAFISGNKRYLGKGANLAFHQYHSDTKSLAPYIDMPSEQRKDLIIYQRRGISQDFIDRIFRAKQDDLWYPTIDEMLSAGVVHGIVNPSDLTPVKYGSFDIDDIKKELANISAFQTIKKYEPETYKKIIANMEVQMKKGASLVEVQQAAGSYIQLLANKSLPRTSNRALIMFARETIKMLEKLEKKDPILCIKYLLPDKYGLLVITNYLSIEEMIPMMDALSLVITDSYESKNSRLDTIAAKELFTKVVIQLGDDAQYLEPKGLENREEYSKACKSIVKFYELILSNNNEIAGNGLRYAFSQ